MKKTIFILMSFILSIVSAYASDGEDGLPGYVLIQTPNNFGQNIMSIQIPDPVSPTTIPFGSYNISSSSKQITVTATSAANTPNLGAPSKSITCTVTQASLAAQGYTKAGSTKVFNSYLNLVKAFTKPNQQLHVYFNVGVCEGIQLY